MTITSPSLPLYGIADAAVLDRYSVPEAAQSMCEAGIEWIQIRAKKVTDSELVQLIEETVRRLESSRARLWVNDRVDLAMLFPVFGVHLGQDDLPLAAARDILGVDCALGLSTHGASQARAAEAETGCDLVACGPVFSTTSKERPDPTIGLELVESVRQIVSRPLVAIGGIDRSNIASVLDTGVDAVAMIGALCRGDVAANSRAMVRLVK